MLNNKGHIVIIKNPVATPLNTSIELIVFPANGMAINIKGIYNIGIYTFPNIIFNWFSFAWNITSGIPANIKAVGLNHPGIVLKSSIIPITKAIIAVITIPIISWNPVKKNKINSLKTKHANKIGPPGLGILGLFGLCLSLTNFPFNVRYLIKIGVIIREIKNDIDVVIIVTIMNSFLFLSSVRKIVEHRQIKSRPIILKDDYSLEASKDKNAPITLVRLILLDGPLSEKQIINKIYKLGIFSSGLSFITIILQYLILNIK